MNVASRSDKGGTREYNEDWCIANADLGLFVVADGVGSHQAGGVASKVISEEIEHSVAAGRDLVRPEDVIHILIEAVGGAHETLLRLALENHDLSGMCSTVVVCYFRGEYAWISHIGDSRAYVVRHGNISPLTEDHSVINKLLKENKITKQEAKRHEMRHVITQCVGGETYRGPDIRRIKIDVGDIILLCSDGLTDMVEEDTIERIVNESRDDLRTCVERLIHEANENGGLDNITVVLVEVTNHNTSE